MFQVITGGSGSGKSAYAEDCVTACRSEAQPLYYIATMRPFGAEMEAKIRRHRQLRDGKGFETIECFRDLSAACLPADGMQTKRPVVLLECMSNLVANEWFDAVSAQQGKATDWAATWGTAEVDRLIEKVWSGIQSLKTVCTSLVVVTNEVFSEAEESTWEMDQYKRFLSGINRKMAQEADRVTEVVYGIPIRIKDCGEDTIGEGYENDNRRCPSGTV